MPESEFLGIPSGLWGAALFCLAIFFQTLFLRRVVEMIRPSVTHAPVWRTKILPSIPFVLGAVEAVLMKKFPRPFESTAYSMLFMYGLTMGGVSGWVYKIVHSQIKKKFGVDVDLSNPPPQGVDIDVHIAVPAQDKIPTLPKEPQ